MYTASNVVTKNNLEEVVKNSTSVDMAVSLLVGISVIAVGFLNSKLDHRTTDIYLLIHVLQNASLNSPLTYVLFIAHQ